MAGGGFGGGGFGGVPWGAFTAPPLGDVFISDTVPVTDSLTVVLPFTVIGAVAISPFAVRVSFSADLDPAYLPNFQTGSYSIAGLTISNVDPGPFPYQVILTTSEQGPLIYTVVVSNAQSSTGDPISSPNSALFAGFAVIPSFYATAQSRRKVQFTFSTAMLQNLDYTNPGSYTITDLNGGIIPIVSVTAVGPSPNRRLAFVLGVDLVPGGYYSATIVSPLVQTTFFLPITPPTDLFQWNENPRPITVTPIHIRISDFSGEVTTGLLGQPLGQVFFSPSLDAPAPNSSIQVAELSVCTRAFDVYTPPSPPDPTPLYTFGGAVTSTLDASSVLFTTFDRLLGAQFTLGNSLADAMGPYDDGPCTATMFEPLDKDFISLLNNPFWTLFDGAGTPFITADNLAPIPPGPTVGPIILQP